MESVHALNMPVVLPKVDKWRLARDNTVLHAADEEKRGSWVLRWLGF